MNIVFESAPEGTTHFLRYASGYIVWCKIDEGQNNQLILSEWDSGNEYWVPGIFPVEHYQKIGLTSIDDLPTQNDVGPDAAAPKGATHRYQHGGETGWYRETEDNLFVWRDGSWYASTQKSAKDLAKVCPFGAVTILTQEVQLADDNEDNLTCLARNVHEWPENGNKMTNGFISGSQYYGPNCSEIVWCKGGITRDQWLARRAELQGKPSWKGAPEWSQWLGQDEDGVWYWHSEKPNTKGEDVNGCRYWMSRGLSDIARRGEILGDWRDTLERRPIDLSEPAGGVKARGTDDAEEINAMAQRLLVALKSDPRSFDTGALAEMVELADADIVKRDAKVCGGEDYLNNHWFERGELPPVGVECEFRHPVFGWTGCDIVAHYKFHAVCAPDGGNFYGGLPSDFRPIRTERDLAIADMIAISGLRARDGAKEIMNNLYDAGYRKEPK